jgi:hypothetical protein
MSESTPSQNRPVWLAIIMITAVLVAAGTAVLFRAAKSDASSTLTAAGTAFAATVTLCLSVWKFLVP